MRLQSFKLKKTAENISENKFKFIIFSLLFIVFVVSRFYDLEGKSVFSNDQIDNAWAAKGIIVDGNFPSVGMQAKGNTGLFIGPYYYYYLVPFYLATDLDPIASGYAAGVVAIFSLVVVWYATREVFNSRVALIAVFIYTFSSYILVLDRTQWPVNFIVPLSFLIFLSLIKILKGDYKYLPLLAVCLGFSFHVHFTAIFFVIYTVIALIFIPRRIEIFKYFLITIPVLLFFAFPIIKNFFMSNSDGIATNYIASSYHGFHLRRFLQISGDGLIEFNSISLSPYGLIFSILAITVFIFLIMKSKNKESKKIILLSTLWILIPWIILSTYSGELTNYYFSASRVIAIFVYAYLIYRVFEIKNVTIKTVVIIFMGYYAYNNINIFLKTNPVNLESAREEANEKIEKGERIEFSQGDPKAYLYYLYERKNSNP